MQKFEFENLNCWVDEDGFARLHEVALFVGEVFETVFSFLDPQDPDYLGDGIRTRGDVDNFLERNIYRDDIVIFVRRHREFRDSHSHAQ